MTFSAKYGPWALVTGSARPEGLGYELARQLAARGLHLILVDVLEDAVEQRARELRSISGVEAIGIGMDLARRDFRSDLLEAVGAREVGLLVCNHMYTPADTPALLAMSPEALDAMIDVNARAYSHLVHAFGNRMVERGRGGILVVTSGAGVTAAPYATSYSANKAYQRLLAEGLWYELRGTGVDVTVLVAGLMNTQGDALSGYPQRLIMETEPVAREALDALGKKLRVIPGPLNKALIFLQSRVLSARAAVSQVGDFMAKGLRKH